MALNTGLKCKWDDWRDGRDDWDDGRGDPAALRAERVAEQPARWGRRGGARHIIGRICRRSARPRHNPSAPNAPHTAMQEPLAIIPIIPPILAIIPLALQAWKFNQPLTNGNELIWPGEIWG